jgi:tetratricopeptide (TPR) repeat protein
VVLKGWNLVFIRVEGFNTPLFRAVKKGIKPRIQIPYKNNIPRPSGRGMLIIFIFAFVIFSCQSGPDSSQSSGKKRENSGRQSGANIQLSGSLAEEIRSLTETGVLSSMLEAVELIRSRELSGSEFGRTMAGLNTILIKLIYPDSPARLPAVDLPQTSNYTRIIREAEKGVYVRPDPASTDFFEHILPFLAVDDQTEEGVLADILKDIEKAQTLKPNSVLPPLFQGFIHERALRYSQAERSFRQAYEISDECYPARIGVARARRGAGSPQEAIEILSALIVRYPDSMQIKRERAVCYYENHDLSRALPAIDEILQADPKDGEIILIKASILMEQGQYSQSNAALDNYAPINPNNRTYLFLRARIQAEGNRNRDSALNYLRSILRVNSDDTEALIYAAGLLMESQRPADQTEGREMLERLRRTNGSSAAVLSLSLRDAVQREQWQEAQGYLNRILAVRRTVQDLMDAYNVERGLGNNARALTYARELYERDNSNHDYAAIYISALISSGRRDEASRILESRFNSAGAGQVKSRYYYLRSRLQTNQDEALSDLRSSLFEDPRNLDAIIAMFEIYHNRREERRAVYYLRQALAIAPEHPLLKRYEKEYASLLSRN